MNKYKTLLLSILSIMVITLPLHAEMYKYVNEKGKTVYTNSLSSVPPDQRPEKKHVNKSESTNLSSKGILTPEEIEHWNKKITESEDFKTLNESWPELEIDTENFTVADLPLEQQQMLKGWLQLEKQFNYKELSESDLNNLDIKLRQQWKEMLIALEGKDVEKALTYFSSTKEDNYRVLFSKHAQKLALDLKKVKIEEIAESSPSKIKYYISKEVVSKGKKENYGSYLVFTRDFVDHEWRIEFF